MQTKTHSQALYLCTIPQIHLIRLIVNTLKFKLRNTTNTIIMGKSYMISQKPINKLR